jgi:DNA-directed RNA polymerase subunit RPC12/RpoP
MMFLPLTPVAEITEEGEELRCAECNRLFGEEEEAVYWGDEYRCEDCSEKLVESVEAEVAEFAEQNCKITETLPKYNPAHEFRCTPEEYESGSKESYTHNSHLCYCRHNCTNYDELIKNLDKLGDHLEGKIHYEAIRSRVDELLKEQIEQDGDEFDEFNEDDES